MGDAAARGSGHGGHASWTDAGSRPRHRAADRRPGDRPRRLRAAESVGDADWRGLRDRHRPLHRPPRRADCSHHRRGRPRHRRLRDELGAFVLGARDRRHADARPRPERAVGDQPRDGRPVVHAIPGRRRGTSRLQLANHRYRDGRLQHRDEHRLHDRVPRRRLARAVTGLADPPGSAIGRRAARCARASESCSWRDERPICARVHNVHPGASMCTGKTRLATPAFWMFLDRRGAVRAGRVGHRPLQRIDPRRARLQRRRLLPDARRHRDHGVDRQLRRRLARDAHVADEPAGDLAVRARRADSPRCRTSRRSAR